MWAQPHTPSQYRASRRPRSCWERRKPHLPRRLPRPSTR
jgi:hypothetical protein